MKKIPAVCILLVILGLSSLAHAGEPARIETAGRIPLFTVAPAISEVSAALFFPDERIVWTLGDSGTGPHIGFTLATIGETTAIEVTGAENYDWEALVADGDGRLWICDVGDNSAARSQVTLYQVDPLDLTSDDTIPVTRSIRATYPEGAMDVEAAVYANNRIVLIEKTPLQNTDFDIARMVAIDIADNAPGEQTAEPVGTLPLTVPVTDAALSPEGVLYLLTYIGIYAVTGWEAPGRTVMPLKYFFYGQQEALVALGRNRFFVAIESGLFFLTWSWNVLPLL